MRMRPPRRSRIFANIARSKKRSDEPHPGRDGLAALAQAAGFRRPRQRPRRTAVAPAAGRLRISAQMVEYTRSQTRGGARKNVGRMVRISVRQFARDLPKTRRSTPSRVGSNSTTTRCAMCAEGRKAMVQSSGESGTTACPMSRLDTIARCVTKPIFGSPVAPDVMYRMARSEGIEFAANAVEGAGIGVENPLSFGT